MHWRSRRFLLLSVGSVVLVAAIGVVIIISILQVGHTKVSTQQTQKTVIPANERQVVQIYNQAAMKQDWATVYATTSKIVVGDTSPGQFAQMMAQQARDSGSVLSITMTSPPIVKTNPDGITYFTIHEQVVIIKNGTSQTQSVISLFILEDGSWKFWFSKRA